MTTNGKLFWGKMRIQSIDSADESWNGSGVVKIDIPCVLTEPLPDWKSDSDKRSRRIKEIEKSALETLIELLKGRDFPFSEIIRCVLYERGDINNYNEYYIGVILTFKYNLSSQFYKRLQQIQEGKK
jgi:hypothetical protein